MFKLENLDLILEGGFKDFVIKNKRGKQYFGANNIFINPSMNGMEPVEIEYYHHLLDKGQTKSYAIIAALLLRQKAEGIKLKSKYISAILEKEGRIRVDLTAPEVEQNQEKVISLIVTNYKRERNRLFYQNNQNENMSVTFTESASMSSYKQLGENAVKFQLISTEREKQFGINEEEFFATTIKEMFDGCDSEIIFQDYSSMVMGSIGVPFVDTPYTLAMATAGTKRIILENMNTKYSTYLQQQINDHNEKITKEGIKELKKEK